MLKVKNNSTIKRFISAALVAAVLVCSLFTMTANAVTNKISVFQFNSLSLDEQFILFADAMEEFETNASLTQEIIETVNGDILRTYLSNGFYIDEIEREVFDADDIIEDGNWYNEKALYADANLSSLKASASNSLNSAYIATSRRDVIKNVTAPNGTVFAGVSIYASFLYESGVEVLHYGHPWTVLTGSQISGVVFSNLTVYEYGSFNNAIGITASPTVTAPSGYGGPYSYNMWISCDTWGSVQSSN